LYMLFAVLIPPPTFSAGFEAVTTPGDLAVAYHDTVKPNN